MVCGDAADAEELGGVVEVLDQAKTEESVTGAGGGGFVGDLLEDQKRF